MKNLFIVTLLILGSSARAFVVQQQSVRRLGPALFSTLDDDADQTPSTTNQYLATCIPGLAPVLAQEVERLGGDDVQTSGNAAVVFQATSEVGLKSLLHLRTAHRLLELIATSEELVQSRDDIHNFVRDHVDVKQLLGNGEGGLLTMSVSVILNKKNGIPKDINHSHYTALSIKNALCDVVRDLRGDRPDVDLNNPDVPLVAVLRGTDADGAELSLYRCLHPSGSLHRRGYRGDGAMHKAAMKESMAAGLLLYAGWDQEVNSARDSDDGGITLVDPMGGSGSLLTEAAMIAANVPPGLMRIKCGLEGHQVPPVLRWKDGQDMMDTWKALLKDSAEEAKEGMQWLSASGKLQILSNDIHDGALDICASSLRQAGLSNVVKLRQGDCSEWIISNGNNNKCFVVTNPPWGVRLTEDMEESWESLRTFLRSNCPAGTEAWVLSGNKESTKHLGLRRSQSMVLKTADQDLRWIQYLIHDKASSAGVVDGDVDTPTKKTFPQQTSREERPPPRRQPHREERRQQERPRYQAIRGERPQGYRARGEAAKSRGYSGQGDNVPLTEREREERRNSWNI